jgi:hypothetical protein
MGCAYANSTVPAYLKQLSQQQTVLNINKTAGRKKSVQSGVKGILMRQSGLVRPWCSNEASRMKARYKRGTVVHAARTQQKQRATQTSVTCCVCVCTWRGSIPGRSMGFSLVRNSQTGAGPHSAFYPVGTEGSFLEDKAVGARR